MFVLGAGFTKAFFPSSPLLLDDHLGQLPIYLQSDYVQTIIDTERKRTGCLKVDLERLLTRCADPLPSDSVVERAQLTLLMDELVRTFTERLRLLRSEISPDAPVLSGLAQKVMAEHVTCVTFNYDDTFDKALSRVSASPRWSPDTGYGFVCESLYGPVRSRPSPPGGGLLLKLHGSLN